MGAKPGHFAVLEARSHRLPRVCRSTYAAELLRTVLVAMSCAKSEGVRVGWLAPAAVTCGLWPPSNTCLAVHQQDSWHGCVSTSHLKHKKPGTDEPSATESTYCIPAAALSDDFVSGMQHFCTSECWRTGRDSNRKLLRYSLSWNQTSESVCNGRPRWFKAKSAQTSIGTDLTEGIKKLRRGPRIHAWEGKVPPILRECHGGNLALLCACYRGT